jgi:hypothetical protein
LSQYLPTAEEYPEDKTTKGEVIAQGTDSALIRTKSGELILTDAKGKRRD